MKLFGPLLLGVIIITSAPSNAATAELPTCMDTPFQKIELPSDLKIIPPSDDLPEYIRNNS